MRNIDGRIAEINGKIVEKEKEIEELKEQRRKIGRNYPLCPYCGKRYKRKVWKIEKISGDRVEVMCPNSHYIRLRISYSDGQVDINKALEEIDEGYME